MISRIDVTGVKEVERYLEAIRKRFINPASEIDSTIKYVQKTIIPQRFEEQKNPLGQPWKPSQRVLKHGGKTLTKSGQLRRSLQAIVSTDQRGINIAFSATGEAAKYASVHNNGMRIRNKSGRFTQMPKRQFAFLTSKEKQVIIRDIWIKGLLAAG